MYLELGELQLHDWKGILWAWGFVRNGIMQEKTVWNGYTNDLLFQRPHLEAVSRGHGTLEGVALNSIKKTFSLKKNVTQMAVPNNNNYGDTYIYETEAWQRLALDYKLAHYQEKDIYWNTAMINGLIILLWQPRSPETQPVAKARQFLYQSCLAHSLSTGLICSQKRSRDKNRTSGSWSDCLENRTNWDAPLGGLLH